MLLVLNNDIVQSIIQKFFFLGHTILALTKIWASRSSSTFCANNVQPQKRKLLLQDESAWPQMWGVPQGLQARQAYPGTFGYILTWLVKPVVWGELRGFTGSQVSHASSWVCICPHCAVVWDVPQGRRARLSHALLRHSLTKLSNLTTSLF